MDFTTDDAAAQSRSAVITAVTVTFLTTSWLSVLARTWVRAVMIRNYGWDDALMFLVLLTYTLFCGFVLVVTSWGFGNAHFMEEDHAFLEKSAAYILGTFSLYVAAMVIFKVSLGIFYLRIVVARWQKITIYVTVSIAFVYGIYYFFTTLFTCGLPEQFLVNAIRDRCEGTLDRRFAVNLTAGIINAVSDFVLAVLPIALVRKANVPLAAKISASMIMLMGCVGSAISFVRLAYISGLTYNVNFFEQGVNITVWSVIEAGICITAASLATLRPLFRVCLDRRRAEAFESEWTGNKRPITAEDGDDDWPLKTTELVFPSVHEMDEIRTPSPSFSVFGVTRKASMLRGKVQYDELTTNPAFPEPGVTRKASLLNGKVQYDTSTSNAAVSDFGMTRKASLLRGKVQWLTGEERVASPSQDPVWRNQPKKQETILEVPETADEPAYSANKTPPNADQFLEVAMKAEGGNGKHARKESKPLAHIRVSSQPKMEEVGVGAWREVK